MTHARPEETKYSQHTGKPGDQLVSVIIPDYNHAQYVGDAIQSVLSQTYSNLEIIVVDDGSTDTSREVVAGFGDRVRYIWQENRGLSAARNTGIQHAQGNLLAFLDADDLWQPAFLTTLVPLFDQPGVGAVYSGSQFIDTGGQLLPQVQTLAPSPQKFRQQLLHGNFIPVHAVLVRRECFEDVCGFDETLTALEDFDMWLRLSRRWLFIGREEVLVLTRVRPDSMSADPERMVSQEQAVIRKHYPTQTPASAEEQSELASLQGHATLRLAIAALKQGQRDDAAKHLAGAFTLYPDLIGEMDTYYGLLMADLPRGRQVYHELQDLGQACTIAARLLTVAFSQMPHSFSRQRQASLASLLVASGQVAYARREFAQARQYLLLAMRTSPTKALAEQSLEFILKSFVKPYIQLADPAPAGAKVGNISPPLG